MTDKQTLAQSLRRYGSDFISHAASRGIEDIEAAGELMLEAARVLAEPPAEPDGLPLVVAGAIFDFAGYMTTRSKVIEVGSTAEAGPVADLVKDWAKLRGLSLDDAAVLSWQEWLPTAPPPAKPAEQCWKCGDLDPAGHAKCNVPACGMREPADPVAEVAEVAQAYDGRWSAIVVTGDVRLHSGDKMYAAPQPAKREPLNADDLKEPKNGKNWRVEWWNESCRMMLPAGSMLDSFHAYKNGTLQFTIKKTVHGIGGQS